MPVADIPSRRSRRIPLSVRLRNEMDSSDPNNNAIALMRMDVCSDKGILSLCDVYGDVLWTPRFHVGKAAADSSNLSTVESASINVLHRRAEAYNSILAEQWPKDCQYARRELGNATPLYHNPIPRFSRMPSLARVYFGLRCPKRIEATSLMVVERTARHLENFI